jgi:hypothetical protein
MDTITTTKNNKNSGHDHDDNTPLPWNYPTDMNTTNANTFTSYYQHPTTNIMMIRKRRLFATTNLNIYPFSNPASTMSFVVAAVVSIRMREFRTLVQQRKKDYLAKTTKINKAMMLMALTTARTTRTRTKTSRRRRVSRRNQQPLCRCRIQRPSVAFESPVCRRHHALKRIGNNDLETWRCRGIAFPRREFLHHEM